MLNCLFHPAKVRYANNVFNGLFDPVPCPAGNLLNCLFNPAGGRHADNVLHPTTTVQDGPTRV